MSIVEDFGQFLDNHITELSKEKFDLSLFSKYFSNTYKKRTSKNFHVYRIKSRTSRIKVFVDSILNLEFLTEYLSEVNDIIAVEWNSSRDKKATQYRINTSAKLFNKSRQTVLEIIALLENGYFVGALSLWRSLYENYVISLFLLNSDEETSKRFNDYEIVERHRLVRSDGKTQSKLVHKVNELKDKYGEQFVTYYGWAKKSARERISFGNICNTTNEKEFSKFYRISSELLHSSSFSVNRSVFYGNDHGNTRMIGSLSKGFEIPYNLSIRVIIRHAERMITNFLPESLFKRTLLLLNDLFAKLFIMEKV